MTLKLLKILLVEEIITNVHWVEEMLWKVDVVKVELTQVTSKDAAIAHLGKKQSDVILFESIAEKGLETIKELDRLYPDIPIVVISNFVSEEAIAQILSIGAQEYLIKSQTDAQ